jgi:N-formylglutamate deformylase
MDISVPTFEFRQGTVPLLVSMPHVGTHIPVEFAANMTEEALRLPDTDWHLEQLYNFLDEIGASILVATHSRYVIDLNRPVDNANLYPGQDTTGLCPVDTFHKHPVYKPGTSPTDAEIQRRGQSFWQPYHAKLEEELSRIRTQHGVAMLWEAHSICSVVPRLFQGRLPDFNFGTAGGASCGRGLGERMLDIVNQMNGYSAVLNGRFTGGYITRQYGKPDRNIHAVQLELAQTTYMNETWPYAMDESRADALRPVLRTLLEMNLDWAINNRG